MGGDDSGVVGITQRELLMEMRDDIRALRSVVESVGRSRLPICGTSVATTPEDTMWSSCGAQSASHEAPI